MLLSLVAGANIMSFNVHSCAVMSLIASNPNLKSNAHIQTIGNHQNDIYKVIVTTTEIITITESRVRTSYVPLKSITRLI